MHAKCCILWNKRKNLFKKDVEIPPHGRQFSSLPLIILVYTLLSLYMEGEMEDRVRANLWTLFEVHRELSALLPLHGDDLTSFSHGFAQYSFLVAHMKLPIFLLVDVLTSLTWVV